MGLSGLIALLAERAESPRCVVMHTHNSLQKERSWWAFPRSRDAGEDSYYHLVVCEKKEVGGHFLGAETQEKIHIIIWWDLEEVNFMEALVSYRISPVCNYSRKFESRFVPSSTLYMRKNNYGTRISLWKHCILFSTTLASAQPVGSAKVGHPENMLPPKEIIELRRSVDAVCFDVDSTVCLDEGIDELAEFCGAGKAVAEWTARAMGGSVPFEDALASRLSLFTPSLSQVENFLEQRPPRLSPGIKELIETLKAKQIDVYLISGGFRQMINPVASILGIPKENIFANQLLFGSSGEFVGFDRNEPTSRSGGKATAVEQIRKAHKYRVLAMIGDGATDLEARRPVAADLFICYAGVQLRESVAAKADWLVFDFQDLVNLLG